MLHCRRFWPLTNYCRDQPVDAWSCASNQISFSRTASGRTNRTRAIEAAIAASGSKDPEAASLRASVRDPRTSAGSPVAVTGKTTPSGSADIELGHMEHMEHMERIRHDVPRPCHRTSAQGRFRQITTPGRSR
jgi:hypothetical protein